MSGDELFERGVEAVDHGNWLCALACFEKLVQQAKEPLYLSYFASCIAKERGQFGKAISLCLEAIETEPDNPGHYLNLGRVYLLQGRKSEAIRTFREGLAHGLESRIIDELNRLGTRKPPVFSFLPRNNPINKYLGMLLQKLRLR